MKESNNSLGPQKVTSQLAAETANYLSSKVFGTKTAMAKQMGMKYGMLLKVCAGAADDHHTKRFMQQIIRYCIIHQISLDPVLEATR